MLAIILMLQMFAGALSVAASTAEASFTVEEVVSMLEGIDTLQQMQDKRSTFKVTKHYNAANASVVAMHDTARIGYETYVADMFAAREAAQQAFDSLTDEQKSEIDPALVAKLNDELPTVFNTQTFPITKTDDEYSYQLISPKFMVYEVSNAFIKTGDVAGTFMLVDTNKTGDTWTPDGIYSYGESNYELTYCCDLLTLPTDGTHYKRTNLEASDYYNEASAAKIRAIVQTAYPFLTIDEMKAELIEGGMDADVVASLTRSDLITGVQMAIWAYANVNDENFSYENVTSYGGSLRMRNHPYIPKIMHDYTNECWNWWSQSAAYRSFDPAVEPRVNALVDYLCALEPVSAEKDQIVISQIKVADAQLINLDDDVYYISLQVICNGGGNALDKLNIAAVSYSVDENGTMIVEDSALTPAVYNDGAYSINIRAKSGDNISVVIEGQQMLAKGAYFYDAGSREISQAMVGVSEGFTNVSAKCEILFTADLVKVNVTDIETGLQEPVSVTEGEGMKINVTVKPENATVKDVIFTSSDETVATVDENGNVIALREGECIITVTSADNPAVYKEIHITVNRKTYTIEVADELILQPDDVKNLNVLVTPTVDASMITYSVDDESVVSVDADGNVTALRPGAANITITVGGDVKVVRVVVLAPVKKTHHICFGKTDGIGWYEVSVNGGDFFPQGPNSTLEVEDGSVLVVRVQDMWIDDNFTFYVNGKKVKPEVANTITLVVDGYMLIGALSMDVEVPDVEESLNWFQKLIKSIKDFFNWLGSLFTK